MRILVTAGPTREYLDSVRFISNASSGKMGYAIAGEAARRGHSVVLISGPVELPEPDGVEVTHVVTAQEMFEAATLLFPECRAAIMVAAVCDYRPSTRLGHKLKKQDQGRSIQLEPTEDICAHLGGMKGDRVLVGFAVEDRDHHRNAEAKLRRKRCDAIVLNAVATVGADEAEIEILRADAGWSAPFAGSKAEIAAAIISLVEELADPGE